MKLDWKAVLGLAITVLLLWWALHDTPFGEVWRRVKEADLLLLLAAVFVATFGFVIRAVRWGVLLTPLRPDTTLRSRFAAVSIGFMANNILPARVGEFARAYAFSRVEPVSVSGAFGTIVVERLLDGLTLLAFLLFAVSRPSFPGGGVLREGPIGAALETVVVVLALLLVGLVVLLVRPRPFVRAAERVAARLPGDFARPAVDAMEAFLDSLVILRRPVLLLKAILWSVAFWLWHGLSFLLGMLAFGIDTGPEPFVAALFTEAVVGFGVAVPSAPGFVGTFHAAADWALSGVYGVEPARSLAFAFGYHFGGWIPITVIGLWYAWKLGLSMKEVERSEERVEEAVEASHPVAVRLLSRRGEADPEGRQNPDPVADAVEIEAPAKVNLALHVLERDDATGYHDIETLFHAVDLTDRLRIQHGGKGMELQVHGADVGPLRENLVWQAAAAFAASTGLVYGLRVRLEKAIPHGAGLGGGSSDAAATLRALDALFGHPLPPGGLAEIGADIGADVSFFLGESTFALGRGRGERLLPLPPLPPGGLVVGVPAVRVDTGEAYRALDRHRSEEPSSAPRPSLPGEGWERRARGAESGDGWARAARLAHNDFEAVILPRYPAIRRVRERLRSTDPLVTLLAGSGGAVFAAYSTEEAARSALAALRSDDDGAGYHLVRALQDFPAPRLV